MHRKSLSILAGATLALGIVAGGVVQPAQAADYPVNVTIACQLAGYSSASLVAGNVYGWRCNPGSVGADIQLWCSYAYAGTTAVYLNYSNPYSWRCRT